MLYYNSRALLRYNDSSKHFKYQAVIVYESAEDRNLRAFFNRVKDALSCNIFTK